MAAAAFAIALGSVATPGAAAETMKRAGNGVPTAAPSGRSVANGRALYDARCASCHGPRGRGDGPDADLSHSPPRNLREGFITRYSDSELVRRILDGQRLQLALDPTGVRARATEVEAIAAHLERLPQVDWRLAERGLEIYVDHCELCHGPYGRPHASLPPGVRTPRDLADPAFQRGIDDAELRTVVRHGRRGMPALSPHWSDEDLRALVAFVRLLSPGYERYTRYCAACHGDDGRGSGSFAEVAVARPTVVFDRAYFARHDPEQVRAAVWHMVDQKKPSMPHFHSQLSDAQARAIVAYLKRAK
jgi:mono/diheme cytochrome c family protein